MNRNQILKIIVGALIIFIAFRVLQGRSSAKKTHPAMETYENWPQTYMTVPPSKPKTLETPTPVPNQPVMTTPGPLPVSVALLPQTSPAPKPGQTSWAEFAPQSLQGQQLLDPQKYIGTDTQGSSLKNASWDLRRDPPIPRTDFGPILNSTIEGDPWRKPLDDCA